MPKCAITFFEPSLFVYFCGNDKSKSPAGLRRLNAIKSSQSPFLSLDLLFTFPVSSHKTREKVKAPAAWGEGKSYRRPSIVIVCNYKMTNNKFVMQRVEVTNDHRAVFVYVWLGYLSNRKFTPVQITRSIFFHFVLNIRFVIFHCNIQNSYQITYLEIFNSSFGIKKYISSL